MFTFIQMRNLKTHVVITLLKSTHCWKMLFVWIKRYICFKIQHLAIWLNSIHVAAIVLSQCELCIRWPQSRVEIFRKQCVFIGWVLSISSAKQIFSNIIIFEEEYSKSLATFQFEFCDFHRNTKIVQFNYMAKHCKFNDKLIT